MNFNYILSLILKSLLQKVYMNINKILSVASHLIEGGHYAAQHIGSVASKLDQVSPYFLLVVELISS